MNSSFTDWMKIFFKNMKPGTSWCSLNVSYLHSSISHNPNLCLCGEKTNSKFPSPRIPHRTLLMACGYVSSCYPLSSPTHQPQEPGDPAAKRLGEDDVSSPPLCKAMFLQCLSQIHLGFLIHPVIPSLVSSANSG